MVEEYAKAKSLYTRSKAEFRKTYAAPQAKATLIALMAHQEYDNGWPLALLRELEPTFADALERWSGSSYEEIRRRIERGEAALDVYAKAMVDKFDLLPLWSGPVTHVSKDSGWLTRLQKGNFRLPSFMSCCAEGYTHAYVHEPSAVLRFTALRTARLLGALTTESLEKEVLLPPGALFRVVKQEDWRTILLEEIAAPA